MIAMTRPKIEPPVSRKSSTKTTAATPRLQPTIASVSFGSSFFVSRYA